MQHEQLKSSSVKAPVCKGTCRLNWLIATTMHVVILLEYHEEMLKYWSSASVSQQKDAQTSDLVFIDTLQTLQSTADNPDIK